MSTMHSKRLFPTRLAATLTVVGATGLVFCVPAVYALSLTESLATSVTSVLVTMAGVGGLWFGVSQGMRYLGDAVLGKGATSGKSPVRAPGESTQLQS